MAASIGLLEFRILCIEFIKLSNFDQVCGSFHGLIMARISDSLAYNVAFPLTLLYANTCNDIFINKA